MEGTPTPSLAARKIFKIKDGGSQNIDSRYVVSKISGIRGLGLSVGLPTNWVVATGDKVYFQRFAVISGARIGNHRAALQVRGDRTRRMF